MDNKGIMKLTNEDIKSTLPFEKNIHFINLKSGECAYFISKSNVLKLEGGYDCYSLSDDGS